jgi:hypothetical protein
MKVLLDKFSRKFQSKLEGIKRQLDGPMSLFFLLSRSLAGVVDMCMFFRVFHRFYWRARRRARVVPNKQIFS